MSASSHRSLSSFSPIVQTLVIRLIQEELHSFLQVPVTATNEEWGRAIQAANPTLSCHYTDVFTIKICPESRSGLLQRLQQELSAAS
jgi:hypothetical protein